MLWPWSCTDHRGNSSFIELQYKPQSRLVRFYFIFIITLSQARLLRGNIAPFLEDRLLLLLWISLWPGADFLRHIHTLELGLEARHKFSYSFAGPLRLEVTSLLGNVLDQRDNLLVTLLWSLRYKLFLKFSQISPLPDWSHSQQEHRVLWAPWYSRWWACTSSRLSWRRCTPPGATWSTWCWWCSRRSRPRTSPHAQSCSPPRRPGRCAPRSWSSTRTRTLSCRPPDPAHCSPSPAESGKPSLSRWKRQSRTRLHNSFCHWSQFNTVMFITTNITCSSPRTPPPAGTRSWWRRWCGTSCRSCGRNAPPRRIRSRPPWRPCQYISCRHC